ncbi:hypothetical protein FMUND_3455 [Fusarium mundagurra]|uniref:Uncharacterized protein n=1 Tax=Fusarium mundagurra TaxID=1567541 RepID=A0A8H5YZY1_9HYPO|nr:hypothetical protein FMUND_3455 [Fusarium mundagurra]
MNQPQRAGRAGGTILQAFLFLFAVTNFLTLILTAVTAGKYWSKQQDILDRLGESIFELKSSIFPDGVDLDDILDRLGESIFELKSSIFPDGVDLDDASKPIGFTSDIALELPKFLMDSSRPYVLLAVFAGITWVITSIVLLFLFTKIRHFNHRVAHYVFRVIGLATSIFLVIFCLTYARTHNFTIPFTIDWPLGKGAAIMAHINLLLGIFITLLAAALDTPKDWDASTGPNSR